MDINIQKCLYISNNGENKLVYANIGNRNVFNLCIQPVDASFFATDFTFIIKYFAFTFVNTFALKFIFMIQSIKFLIIFRSPELHVCKRFYIL